jgi:hypothetical protein
MCNTKYFGEHIVETVRDGYYALVFANNYEYYTKKASFNKNDA